MTPSETAVRERLAALDTAQLALLLRRRRALEVPWPADLDQLAHRLVDQASVNESFTLLPLPQLQVLGAAALCEQLGEQATPAAVARRLGATDIEQFLDELSALQLAWVHAGHVVTVGRFPIVDRPYGAGIAVFLEQAPLAMLRPMSTKVGLRADGPKQEVVGRLLAFFRDTDAVAALIASASNAERTLLDRAARTDATLYPHPIYLNSNTAGTWSVERGLAWQLANGPVMMPVEATLAILGSDFTLPFDPDAPEVATRPVSTEHVEAEAATRLLRMIELVSNIVATATSTPIALLKSGKIGVRTIRGLAKDLHAEVDEIQLAFELAVTQSLLLVEEPLPPRGRKKTPTEPATLIPSTRVLGWLASDAGVRGTALLQSWWESHYLFLAEHVELDTWDLAPRNLRVAVLRAHLGLPSGAGLADHSDMKIALAWAVPCLNVDTDALNLTMRECELMGVTALGAATTLGAAVEKHDILGAAQQLVSNAHTRATIGADLTAVVFGPPDSSLAAFLDSVADRESTGAATTWRFGPSSLRRAFDNGTTLQELLSGVEAFSVGDVPQALTYLIHDVSRTHGAIGIVAVGCAVVAEDAALIAEVGANRRLSKLGPTVLAPTVVGFTAELEVVLASLRDAGYAPVQRDSDGAAVLDRGAEAEGTEALTTSTIDFDAQAKYLLDATPLAEESRQKFIGSLHADSDPTGRVRFVMGLASVIEYESRTMVVHSARMRGESVELWNESEQKYETLHPAHIRVVS